MSRAITVLLLATLLLSAVLGWRISALEHSRRAFTEDAIELSKVKYGLFNVDVWKVVVADVVTKKVEELEITNANRQEMRARISTFLYKLISDLEGRFERENRGVLGGIRNAVSGFLGIFDKMKRDVPTFTEEILNFLDDPRNRNDLRNYIVEKINTYADDTFSETDYTTHDYILENYGYTDRSQAIAGLEESAEQLNREKKPYTHALYLLFALVGVWLVAVKGESKQHLTIATAIALIPLYLGVSLPMIELDARIAEMRFQLLGEPVAFTNQVLFYKSKSILEVVELMVAQGKLDLAAVGVLVLTFSIFFPLAKLISSLVYIHKESARTKKAMRFMVFKTGKWSMADVMVVAIFMAYIGFSGIISEQLSQLEGLTQNMDMLTTNKSQLHVGFFMFAIYVLLGLLIAQRIKATVK
ncbi:MAG: paraquat-inducible protein A [Cryomorphaceae bacterium]|nr:paraquat-inducible protein A [Flavobacteriales bacterium]